MAFNIPNVKFPSRASSRGLKFLWLFGSLLLIAKYGLSARRASALSAWAGDQATSSSAAKTETVTHNNTRSLRVSGRSGQKNRGMAFLFGAAATGAVAMQQGSTKCAKQV